MTLDAPERLFHLRAFRQARVGLLDDAEAYLPVFVCLENLGRRLYKGNNASPRFVNELVNPLTSFLAPYAYDVSVASDRQNHIESLLKRLARARNDAVHSGLLSAEVILKALGPSKGQDRAKILNTPIGDLATDNKIKLSLAKQIQIKTSADEARAILGEKAEPLLVIDEVNHLVGIVMAFDLL